MIFFNPRDKNWKECIEYEVLKGDRKFVGCIVDGNLESNCKQLRPLFHECIYREHPGSNLTRKKANNRARSPVYFLGNFRQWSYYPLYINLTKSFENVARSFCHLLLNTPGKMPSNQYIQQKRKEKSLD